MAFRPLLLLELLDRLGVEPGAVVHLPVGLLEVDVAAEEVGVGQDVGGDQLLLQEAVGLQEVGVAGLGVEDQLVDPLQSVVVAGLLAVVLGAVGPVGKSCRE